MTGQELECMLEIHFHSTDHQVVLCTDVREFQAYSWQRDFFCNCVDVFILTKGNLWLQAFSISECAGLNTEDIDTLVEQVFNQENFKGRN